MKKFFKNKFVVLTITIVVLSVVYFRVNKAIKQYNFSNDDDIVSENEGGEYSNEEVNLVLEEDFDGNDVERDEFEGGGSENVENVEKDDKEREENGTNSENKIYVYITGEVSVPGVVILNENSRIVDAINAAGGTTSKANVSKVNLAYVLKDGMKVNIPNDADLRNNPDFEYITMSSGDGRNDASSGIVSSGGSYGSDLNGTGSENGQNGGGSSENISGSNSSHSIGVVNINTATQTELETLPGIGPSIALKIINYRNENGRFSSIEEIKNVSGIGDSKFEALKKYITVWGFYKFIGKHWKLWFKLNYQYDWNM